MFHFRRWLEPEINRFASRQPGKEAQQDFTFPYLGSQVSAGGLAQGKVNVTLRETLRVAVFCGYLDAHSLALCTRAQSSGAKARSCECKAQHLSVLQATPHAQTVGVVLIPLRPSPTGIVPPRKNATCLRRRPGCGSSI